MNASVHAVKTTPMCNNLAYFHGMLLYSLLHYNAEGNIDKSVQQGSPITFKHGPVFSALIIVRPMLYRQHVCLFLLIH